MDALGYSGGFILSFCLVPQIYRMLTTRQTNDISYGWTAM